MTRLNNVRVIVAGAGFAGLSAARALEGRGASVTVIEARDRVGGRVWTIRDGFARGQHAEIGADLIESSQTALVALAHELHLPLVHINKRGFGYYGPNSSGRLGIQSIATVFESLDEELAPLIRAYVLAERRWSGAIAQQLARESVADWLHRIRAPKPVVDRLRGLRGLFLADPEDLSLLALVDFFSDFESQGGSKTFRVKAGNDSIATTIASKLRTPCRCGAILRRVRQDQKRVIATVEDQSKLTEIEADYAVVALPAPMAHEVRFEPALPAPQHDALAHLRNGPATRVLLQFARRFWQRPGRQTAFGSSQATGAVWDGNEQQAGPEGILTLLSGGRASNELQQILRDEGTSGVIKRLSWLGRPARVVASRTVTWETDPWAGGGYAVFGPGFDPTWRDVLPRPHGRVMFAGEHTSARWQGYMNGAVETGERAAAEIAMLHDAS